MSTTRGRVVRVVADLRPEPLEGHDGVLVAALTSDLVSNALTSGTPETAVSLTSVSAESDARHCTLMLAVTCACGDATYTEIQKNGTTDSARRRLRSINGDLVLQHHGDGTHTTTATWPTRVRAEPLPRESLAQIGQPADGGFR